jgi:hypothetical protein
MDTPRPVPITSGVCCLFFKILKVLQVVTLGLVVLKTDIHIPILQVNFYFRGIIDAIKTTTYEIIRLFYAFV